MRQKRWMIFSLILLVGGVALASRIFLVDCSSLEPGKITRDIVAQVWPAPNATIPIKCFLWPSEPIIYLERRGVGATLVTVRIDDKYETKPKIPIESRVELVVDGRTHKQPSKSVEMQELVLCDDNNNCVRTGRPATINVIWEPFLVFGSHNVLLRVTTDAGKILEYSWRFTITW